MVVQEGLCGYDYIFLQGTRSSMCGTTFDITMYVEQSSLKCLRVYNQEQDVIVLLVECPKERKLSANLGRIGSVSLLDNVE